MARRTTSTRPCCAACGKLYGTRDVKIETVRWPAGEEMPPYKGNGIIVKTGRPWKVANRATIRGVTALSVNAEIRAHQEQQIAAAPEQSLMVNTRDIWDGVSYRTPYKPFCTLRCALAFARAACAAGWGTRKVS
jgi:hypothetical protein